MRLRLSPRLAWVVFGCVCFLLVAAIVLSVLNVAGLGSYPPAVVVGLLGWVAMMSFPVVGLLIATRQPHNAVGWILLGIGLAWQLGAVTDNYVRYGFVINPGAVPRPDLVAVLGSTTWIPGVGLMGTFLILLFPNGRLPSPRWKPFAWFCAAVLVGLSILLPLLPGRLSYETYLLNTPNPLGVEALRPVLSSVFKLVLLIPLCIAGCASSLIVRFRRSSDPERLQLKWLAAVATLTAVIYLAMMVVTLPYSGADEASQPGWITVFATVAVFAFVLIPIAIGIAILRYRLYDIDLIINRALVYGALSAALAITYVIGVVGVGAAVRAVTGQASNNLAVAGSTLAIAGLFGPLRRRIQSFIDRRFYRRKYDAEQTVAAFSARLRDQVDLDSLNHELVNVVTTTVQPAHVSLWLKSPSP